MSARCATIFTTFATAVLLLSTLEGTIPHYIWNASNSVPIGLYRLQPVTTLTVTELVAVQPPDLLAAFLDLNGYLPLGVPMLKRVLALHSVPLIVNDRVDVALAAGADGVHVGQEDMPVEDAYRLMEEEDVERLPVTEDGRLVGVLSRSALTRRLAEDEPPDQDSEPPT